MRLHTFECKNCLGHDFCLDKSLNRAICLYCGTSSYIQEEDNSDIVKARNCLKLADYAFSFENNEEAYDYYLKALEYGGDNYWPVFRKGYCAVLLSTRRIREFIKAINDSCLLLSEDAEWDGKYTELLNEAFEYVKIRYSNVKRQKEEYTKRIPT